MRICNAASHWGNRDSLGQKIVLVNSVAEPKLFIFASGSDFDHNFGSGSSSSYSQYWYFKLF